MSRAKKQQGEHVWFALADGQRCRLLRCNRTALGTHRVRELGVRENAWPKQGRDRVAASGGMSGQRDAGPTDYVGEQLRGFLQEVLDWLKTECTQRRIDRFVVIAVPRVLHELRKPPNWSNGRFVLRQGDLTRFSTSALAVHPLIRRLIDDGNTSDDPPSRHETEKEH